MLFLIFIYKLPCGSTTCMQCVINIRVLSNIFDCYSPNISRKYAADPLQVVDVEERNLLFHQKVEVRLEAVVC